MNISPEEFERDRKWAEDMARQAEQAAGGLREMNKRLHAFGCKTLREARAKHKKIERQRDRAAREYHEEMERLKGESRGADGG